VYKPLNNDKNNFSIAMYKVPKKDIFKNFSPLIKHEREWGNLKQVTGFVKENVSLGSPRSHFCVSNGKP